MPKEWRIPFALVTADVLALSLSFVVLIVLFEATAAFSPAWSNIFEYGAYVLSAALLIAWLVVSWRRLKRQDEHEKLIAHPKELALASLGILLGGCWLATAGVLQSSMSGLTVAYVFTGLVVSPWIMIMSAVWFWYSV
jgi:hypothetical protein